MGKPNTTAPKPAKAKAPIKTQSKPGNPDWTVCASPGCGSSPVISRFDFRDGKPVCINCASQDAKARPHIRVRAE